MNGAKLIAQERKRQIEEEGWTAVHDEQHRDGDLALAGVCYVMDAVSDMRDRHEEKWLALISDALWPWECMWWKPTLDRVRQLVKAGALIAAEIDKLQRETK